MKRLLAVMLLTPTFTWAQNFDVTPDQMFAAVGRCTIEVSQLRVALREAQAKISELAKLISPPSPDAPKEPK